MTYDNATPSVRLNNSFIKPNRKEGTTPTRRPTHTHPETPPAPCIVTTVSENSPKSGPTISPRAFSTECPSEISVTGATQIKDLGEIYRPDVRSLSRRVSQRITGSRRFYDLLTTLYPATIDPPVARLFVALLSPH